MQTLPTIRLGGVEVSRLIIGGNPFSGNSHQSAERDRDMMDYFTTERIKATLFECERHGLTAMQSRGDRHILRMLRGADNRFLILGSALLGATILSLADLAARLVLRPAELPIGVVTSAVGVPIFLYLLRRRQYIF